MKIIDLLNKIANGEEVPPMIRYVNAVYSSIKMENLGYTDYEDVKSGDLLFADRIDVQERLNDEVEIIEEDKKIEKLKGISKAGDYKIIYPTHEILMNKINEIIDYINNKD